MNSTNAFFWKMKDKIQRWWRYTWIRSAFRECKQGIRNLWRWFPVIWNDRDWDYTFIYSIIAKKLEHQAKHIAEYGVHDEATRDAQKMLTVVRLIQRQRDDFYHYECHDYYDAEWKKIPLDAAGTIYSMDEELLSDNLDAYFARYPRQYKRVMSGEVNFFSGLGFSEEQEKDRKTIAMEIARENQDRCRRLLFKIMEENIERWWD